MEAGSQKMYDEGKGRRTVRKPVDILSKGNTVYTGKCDVRLSSEEDSALSRLAERNGVTRSEVMRKALRDFVKFNTDEDL
jgi:hypothetical protein